MQQNREYSVAQCSLPAGFQIQTSCWAHSFSSLLCSTWASARGCEFVFLNLSAVQPSCTSYMCCYQPLHNPVVAPLFGRNSSPLEPEAMLLLLLAPLVVNIPKHSHYYNLNIILKIAERWLWMIWYLLALICSCSLLYISRTVKAKRDELI